MRIDYSQELAFVTVPLSLTTNVSWSTGLTASAGTGNNAVTLDNGGNVGIGSKNQSVAAGPGGKWALTFNAGYMSYEVGGTGADGNYPIFGETMNNGSSWTQSTVSFSTKYLTEGAAAIAAAGAWLAQTLEPVEPLVPVLTGGSNPTGAKMA